MIKMPKLWEVLRKFKDFCKFRGWKISENYDWVETGNRYHNFVWTRNVHPSSFRRVAANGRCVVKKGLSYRVVEASYTAWLFSETPPKTLIKTIFENQVFPKRIALYDLSPLLKGKGVCSRLNQTDSTVFQEFENFLEKELNVRFKSLPESEPNSENYTVARLS